MPSPTSGASETINPVKSTYITTSSLQSGKGRTSWAAHSKTCFHAADVAGRPPARLLVGAPFSNRLLRAAAIP